ncbi:unknown [Bacteroides sp. CAG:1076]|nr:unknown [Bacteroides sp. CAG:1076]
MRIVIFQLFFQYRCAGIAVGGTFFKAVILLHGLVVQVLTVHHKQYFVYTFHLAGQTSCFEGSKRLAASRGVPHKAAAFHCAVLLVVG